MANETQQLAAYAAKLRYADLPLPVIQRAKDCIADTIATIAYGAHLPWSRMVTAYAGCAGGRGKSRILSPGGGAVPAPSAAMANGAMAHAFELDNLTWPNSGVHPGATMMVPALAVAQERGIGGREMIAAFVAGAEVMIRIGRATRHNNEHRGYHAPGTTGPFGGAVAVGRLLKFGADRMTNAMGIAGSLSSGLLEFARSGTGAMVKRLHMGRAAEGGVLAASLAAEGFTGPKTILEGPFRSLASRVTVSVADEAKHGHTLASTMTVTLNNGTTLSRRVADFKGTPESPLDAAEMREKFLLLTRHCDHKAMERLFDRLQDIESERTLDWIKVGPAPKARPRTAKRKKKR
jgi:2-methylcitrate dehydratase PrpD